MANDLFNEQMQKTYSSQFNLFKNNPLGYLMQKNIDIPQQYVNDPRGAVQYLLNNGQMSQAQFNSLMQKAQQIPFKF